jgi:gas vesicle protein
MEKPKRKGSVKQVLLGLALGVAVGAVATILLAPDSGANLRAVILRRGTEAREQGTTSYLALSQQLQARYTDALEESRAAYVRTKRELANRYSRAKSGQL